MPTNLSLKVCFTSVVAFLLALGTMVSLMGCNEETTIVSNSSGRESLSDPRVMPMVVATIPQNYGVGPFNVYNRGDNIDKPHFSVQFNKYINSSEVGPEVVTCEGFDRPVYVVLQQGSLPRKTAAFSEILSFEIRSCPSSYCGLVAYDVGRAYTFTIDGSLQDINGNRLGSDYRFSFTPEPYFRVVEMYPPEGASGLSVGSGSTLAYIVFNSNVGLSILPMLQISPSAGGRWRWTSSDSSLVYYQSDSVMSFGTTYTVSVSANARDSRNNQIHQEFRSTFSTAPFHVSSTSPASGSTITDLTSSILFIFSGPVDTSTLRSNFTITPNISGTLAPYYSGVDDMFLFTPTSGWLGGRQYTVTLSTGLRATNGTPLAAQQVFTFSFAPFRVTSTSPSDGSTDVNLTQPVYVYLNAPINISSVASAFRISPPVTGTFSTYSGSTLAFYPTPGWAAGTTYAVTIDTNLRAFSGSPLSSPYSFSFATQPFRVSYTSPSNGDTSVSTSNYLYVSFNAPVDTGSVRSNVSIVPATPGNFSLSQGSSTFSFYASGGFRPGTTYTVTLSPQIRAASGGTLGSQYQFWFKTRPFMVSSVYPTAGSIGVSRYTTIEVHFTYGLNSSTVQNAFRISPNAAGYLSSYQGSTYFYFSPSSALSPNTTYTVTIGTAIRSTTGDSLTVPYVFPFTTGP